jgi:hypothetical protein
MRYRRVECDFDMVFEADIVKCSVYLWSVSTPVDEFSRSLSCGWPASFFAKQWSVVSLVSRLKPLKVELDVVGKIRSIEESYMNCTKAASRPGGPGFPCWLGQPRKRTLTSPKMKVLELNDDNAVATSSSSIEGAKYTPATVVRPIEKEMA